MLQAQFGESVVPIRPATQGPVEKPILVLDGKVVNAGVADLHQAGGVEFPVLVAVGAMPLPGIVVRLIGEANGDPAAVERPELFDEAVVQFRVPFPGEEKQRPRPGRG